MAKPQPKGLLIDIEGIDAAGKRTQTSLLVGWMRRKGISVSTASFPDYSTTVGKEIRRFLYNPKTYSKEAGHMLFAVNRWENRGRLESLLEESDVTVVDRYTESNLAYGVANGLPLGWLSSLETGLPKADLVLILDAPPHALYGRRPSGKDKYERSFSIQTKAREAYKALAPKFGWKVIDASGSIQRVHESVTSEVGELLSARRLLKGQDRKTR
ncbi:MAG: dTMP kinase [Nitrososphaerota archaeon]|nr:dTMP kinase [Nitrososphaerota archaeon]